MIVDFLFVPHRHFGNQLGDSGQSTAGVTIYSFINYIFSLMNGKYLVTRRSRNDSFKNIAPTWRGSERV